MVENKKKRPLHSIIQWVDERREGEVNLEYYFISLNTRLLTPFYNPRGSPSPESRPLFFVCPSIYTSDFFVSSRVTHMTGRLTCTVGQDG